MTAIWLLSSRGRPNEAQEAIDACMDAKMTSPGVLYVDETVDRYRGIRLPKNWTIHYEPKWGSLQASLQWAYGRYPDASQYGWLADDVRPRTNGWDRILERAAGDWCLSYARDMWLSEQPNTLAELHDGCNLSSGLCWGGKLVREVGWWATPGLRQAYIDVVWCRIIEPLGLARYVHDVTVEHLNYRTGKREKDAVDDWSRDGTDYVSQDILRGVAYVGSDVFVDLIKRLTGRVPRQAPSETQVSRAVGLLRDAYASAHWQPGMSAARLDRVLQDFDTSGKGEDLAKALTEVRPADSHEGQA